MIRFACSYEGSHTYLTAPAGRFTVPTKPCAV